jgi:hypothetical protein
MMTVRQQVVGPRPEPYSVGVTRRLSTAVSALCVSVACVLLVEMVLDYRDGASALRLCASAAIVLSASGAFVWDLRRRGRKDPS